MADIVLSSVDLDVFSGPEIVNLSVDVGATGDRGSRIWAGPNGFATDLIGKDVKLYDVYIDTTTYQMFQYVQDVGSPTWTLMMILPTGKLSSRVTTTFTADTVYPYTGLGVITYNLAPPGASVDDYVFLHSIRGSASLIASTHVLVMISGVLYMIIRASRFNGTSWIPVTGTWNVDIELTYRGAVT